MRTLAPTLAAAVLTLTVAAPVAAQDASDELADILAQAGEAAASELDLLEERLASDDWMVFESASHDLVHVHLPDVARMAPLVRELRREGSIDDPGVLAARLPTLWQAWTLFEDAPEDVLQGTPDDVAAWARDRFAHLQSAQQRERLLAEQEAEVEGLMADIAFAGEILATETPLTETPATEVLAAEPVRCGEDVLPWSTDPSGLHDRFSGVWEYYGTPGLTLNRVGDVVCATYGGGDGWMKLAIIDEHTLKGRWYEGEHVASCAEERAGTYHWGWLEMRFDEDFESYVGELAVCDGSPVDDISGAKSW